MSHSDGGRGARGVMVVLGGVIAVVLVMVGTFWAVGGADETDTAGPGAGASVSSTPDDATPDGATSAAPGATEATEAGSPTASLPPEAPWRRQATRASRQGFPAMAPAGLPSGWVVTGVEYDDAAATWHLEVTSPDGELVSVDQHAASVSELVAAHADGARRDGRVNLSRWQIGFWDIYSGGDIFAVGRALPDTTILVSGAGREAVLTTTKRLMTVETARGGEGD